MKKRIISVLISAVLIISFATTAFAAGNTSNGSEKSDVAADYMSALEGEDGDTVGDEDKQPSKRIEIGEDGRVCLYDENNAPISGFVKIGEYWYYGDSEGKAVVGLQKVDGKWYFFNSTDGKMLTGMQKTNGYWRYFDPADGKMLTGLQNINDSWYYFDLSNGRMVTGLKKIDEKWYFFNSTDGKMLTGLQKTNGYWRYFDSTDGKMLTGLQKTNGYWRYFSPSNGRMLTGWQKVNGYQRYFDISNGRMLTGWQKINGYMFYFDLSTGKMLTGLQKINGYWYYLSPSNGRMLTGLQKMNGYWRYFNPSDGKMLTGWQRVNGYKRYFDLSNGRMLTGTQTIDGKKYNFDSSGRLVTGTVTAMGITVPVNTRNTYLHMEEVAEFTGHLSQDGSWKKIDASKTTPKRGDIIVYYNPHDQYYAASHVCICVTDYNGKVYKAVDGNYGDGDGKVRSGYGADETPNKGWPDSFQDEKDGYQNKETAMYVWRSTKYAEQMASAAEDVLAEFKSFGQYKWLKTYIPESYYGGWCYYLIPIAVAMAAR